MTALESWAVVAAVLAVTAGLALPCLLGLIYTGGDE